MPTPIKKAEAATTDLLPLLEAGGPDDRLFIACGCGHRAAFHHNLGCQYVTPAKPPSSQYSSTTPGTPEVPCTCPTPREVVYLGGRVAPKPEAAAS